MELATAIGGLFSPAAAAAAPVVTAAGPAASGFSLSSLLSGGATVFSMISSIGAGNADAEAAELAADDAAREVPLETLQGITRRNSIKAEMMQRVGEMDTAYAASGTDLSFGTPSQARKEAFQQADLGLTSDNGTEQTRVARLNEREKAYRRRASRARASGWLDALATGASAFSSSAKATS